MFTTVDFFDYLVMPTLLFLGILIFWFLQSVILLFITRRFIFPVLYRNKLTEWFIIEFAIAVHEISHLFAAVSTGSEINFKESFVTSKGGRIAARTSQSIGGWISTVIAAFAPAFVPSFIFFIVSILVFSVKVPLYKVIDADPYIPLDLYIDILLSISSVTIEFILSLIFNPSLLSLIIIYFMLVSSLTSTPSEDDWKASLNVLFSFPVILLFIIFLLLNYIFIQFNHNLILLVSTLLLIVFIYVTFGILFNILLIILIAALGKAWGIFLKVIRRRLNIEY